MADPFLGQLMLVPYNFAPQGWSNCDGQLLAISQFSALFSLLGCTYGGDCRTTFALPDLRGRVPLHTGTGPGLPNYPLGAQGGSTTVTLTNQQIPSHTHTASGTVQATSNPAEAFDPGGNILAQDAGTGIATYIDQAPDQPMRAGNVAVTVNADGGGQSHNNMQPYLTLRWIIALQGIYPSRN